jgi:hypothetical protein
MAKKSTIAPKQSAPKVEFSKAAAPKAAPAIISGPVRNSAIPKITRKEVTHEQIAKRAYEISRGGTGGTEIDNWLRAERELKA